MNIVEAGQEVVSNDSGLSISDGGVISEDILNALIEEFNMLEIFENDKAS